VLKNIFAEWTYEVEKLDSINAPLKIVIGYMKTDVRNKEFDILKTQRKNLHNCNVNNEFGIILMNNAVNSDDKNDPFGICAYQIKDADNIVRL